MHNYSSALNMIKGQYMYANINFDKLAYFE